MFLRETNALITKDCLNMLPVKQKSQSPRRNHYKLDLSAIDLLTTHPPLPPSNVLKVCHILQRIYHITTSYLSSTRDNSTTHRTTHSILDLTIHCFPEIPFICIHSNSEWGRCIACFFMIYHQRHAPERDYAEPWALEAPRGAGQLRD